MQLPPVLPQPSLPDKERRLPMSAVATEVVAILRRRAAAIEQAHQLLGRFAVSRARNWQLLEEHDRLVAEVRDGRDVLRSAMHAYGASLKTDGVPPEHLVSVMRHLLSARRAGDIRTTPAQLIDDAVTWGIEGYYAPA